MTDNDSTAQFIASLVKSLQALCHGYVDFQKNIEIIGHIYINVDSQQKFDYIVNEQVCKNGDESPAMFVSNSFHALPNHKPVRTFVQNDAPLDLKTIVAKDVSGVDLSTFHSDTGQGRSTSRESSQSLSAGSECGSLSGNLREPISSSSRQNPENYVSRRKRHLNNVSSKHSPTASPTPPSRSQEGERRDPKDSPMLRSQYTLGASASKLARRISSELERQSLPNPAYPSDSEIQARLSSPSDHSRPDPGAYQRHYPEESRPHPDHMNDPPGQEGSLEEGIDLTRVKEEVVDEEQLFDQFDWAHGTRDTGQDTSFPRTGPDDPASEGPTVEGEETERGETSPSSALYPIMLHHNTAGLPGYGSPVFPQNFSDTPHTMSASSSPVPSTSGQPSPGGGGGGGFPGRRQQSGHTGRGYNAQFTPRPGKVPQDVAAKFNESEISVKKELFQACEEVGSAQPEETKYRNRSHGNDRGDLCLERSRHVSRSDQSDFRTQDKHLSSNICIKSENLKPSECDIQDKSGERKGTRLPNIPIQRTMSTSEDVQMPVFQSGTHSNASRSCYPSEMHGQRARHHDTFNPSTSFIQTRPPFNQPRLLNSSAHQRNHLESSTHQSRNLTASNHTRFPNSFNHPVILTSTNQPSFLSATDQSMILNPSSQIASSPANQIASERRGPAPPYNCSLCPYSHPEEAIIMSHIASVHRMESFVCQSCALVFLTEKDFSAHRKHKHGRGFECEQCGKIFTLKCNLVEHVKRIHEHGVNARHFICPVQECRKTFTRPSHLRVHVTRNHPGDPFLFQTLNDLFYNQ